MTRRPLIVLALVVAWFGVVVCQLANLQLRRHDEYLRKAEKQQSRVVMLTPPRGTIFDRRGHELAVSVEVRSVAADPSRIADPTSAAAALAEVLDLDAQKLAADLDSERAFVWVKRKIEPPLAERVAKLNLKGVFLLAESKRYYPLRSLAAQVLGFAGLDNKGLAGLEYLYDRVVTSQPGQRTMLRDAHFGTVLHPRMEVSEARPGKDLRLTLDATIQDLVERELAAAVASSHARRGSVVVMDPQSGAILAMASYPTFDPNRFSAYPEDSWRNQPVMDAFEPGSTFKIVTLAAALEAGVVDPSYVVNCEMGGITLDGVRIDDHRPFGRLTVRQVIAWSSNVGAIKMGRAAGAERLFETVTAFGFGRPTGIDLPSESAGILRPLGRWSPLTPAYVSFGQGIATTALQLTNACAAIANGGRLRKPHVVAAIGREGEMQPTRRRDELAVLPIARSTIGQVRALLEGVVVRGTGEEAAVAGYRVAGKTGTGQKAVRGGGYSATKHVAGFVGFVPVSRPALVITVILDEPWPLYHGGEVAAPVFAAIASRALLYLGVPPDLRSPDRWPEARLAAHRPTDRRPQAVPAGTVPDFTGLTARQAVRRSSALGVELALNGHGAVARQAPAPGTPLEAASAGVEVWLSPEAL